jgi:uncharacterized protein YhfF
MALMVEPDRLAAAAMWAAYRAAHSEVSDEPLVAETFGDSPELADELLQFVLEGSKRATAGMVAEFLAEGEPLPRVGGHWIACDGSGAPRAVLRSVELRLGPLSSVDDQFAWDEGEYDRTLVSWLDGHRRYFHRACAALGIEFSDEIELCFERFRVVWPPEIAD